MIKNIGPDGDSVYFSAICYKVYSIRMIIFFRY